MLEQFLSLDIFKLLLVFTRVAATITLMPAIGTPFVQPQLRIGIAFAMSLLLLPTLGPELPGMPGDTVSLFVLILGEAMIGIFLGTIIQIMLAALHMAGTVISFLAGLANALVMDPLTEQQGSIVNGLLANAALMLIFATGMHHQMFRAIVDSYSLFPAATMLPIGDIVETASRLIGKSYLLALQIASPFIVMALVFNAGMGILSRLIPQMQVYFVALPLQIFLGLALLLVSLPITLMWYLSHFDREIGAFILVR